MNRGGRPRGSTNGPKRTCPGCSAVGAWVNDECAACRGAASNAERQRRRARERREGITPAPPGRPPSRLDVTREAVLEALAAGASVRSLTKRFNCSQSVILTRRDGRSHRSTQTTEEPACSPTY